MADKTHIEWTDSTWNVITGCTLVSDGCKHCYAATLAATRLKHHPSREGLARLNAAGEAKFTGEVRFNEQWLEQPLRWRKPRMIFVCAHGDLFHESVPDEWIDRVFAVMALAPQHTFQVLTKRADRMRAYLSSHDVGQRWAERTDEIPGGPVIFPETAISWSKDGLPNVWLGVSIENQEAADKRIPDLLATPAAVRFVSAEPLLGPVDLTNLPPFLDVSAAAGIRLDALKLDGPYSLNWVIVGGESGRNARPMHPDWVRSLRDQCVAAGTKFFFKQWGEFDNWGDRTGKRAAGRLLDGCEWSEVPNA
jgi:protein gp37